MKRLSDDYFERVYREAEDPWGFDTRSYERRKYALTVAVLPRPRYARAFEPGCAFGALSELLAPRCDALFACELVPKVAERARQRVRSFAHVQVETAGIPEYWPSGPLDLVVLSEVAYYVTDAGAHELLAKLEASTTDDAHVVAVHYRGQTDYPRSGDAVHAQLRTQPFLHGIGRYEEELFVMELFARRPR